MGKQSESQSSLYPKIAVFALGIAFVFHLIAIGATTWAYTPDAQRYEHIGLWRYCSWPHGSSGESCDQFVNIIYGDWLKAVQSFWIFGMFAVPAALGVGAMFAFVETYTESKMILAAAMGASAFAGVMNLISVSAFGACFQEYFDNRDPINWAGNKVGRLGWTYGLAATDMILCFVALGLQIGHVITRDSDTGY